MSFFIWLKRVNDELQRLSGMINDEVVVSSVIELNF